MPEYRMINGRRFVRVGGTDDAPRYEPANIGTLDTLDEVPQSPMHVRRNAEQALAIRQAVMHMAGLGNASVPAKLADKVGIPRPVLVGVGVLAGWAWLSNLGIVPSPKEVLRGKE